MDFKIVIPVIISFVISVILAPVIIPFLRRLKASQTERTDGVKSHLSKAGTPTMGGLIFLIAVTVTSLLYIKDYPKIIPILFLTLGFGLIGFLDDYLNVVLKRSDGLLPAPEDGRPDRGNCNFCFLSDSALLTLNDHCWYLSLMDITGISAGWQYRFYL